ncbi:MAG: hypothetical protein J6B89_01535 [Bacilli bacterium]|nr:hypothetical protein [Bacilli bacterium]
MDEIFYYSELYDIYGNLLTEKQRLYFEDYYFNNLSLGEIAENYSISRNAVYNQLQIIIKHLKEYDEKMSLLDKKRQFDILIDSGAEYISMDDLKKIIM